MSCVGFVNYTEYLDGVKEILTEEQYKLYAVALIEYTTYGKTEIEDPLVRALLLDRVTAIKQTDEHYIDCVMYGHLGGRKRCFTQKHLYYVIHTMHIFSLKGLADYFSCSVRTVNRYITNKKLKELEKEYQASMNANL